MRASGLQELIVAALVKREGGSARRWRLVLGPIKVHERSTHPDVNWDGTPTGSGDEVAAVGRLLDEVRLTHSIVERG